MEPDELLNNGNKTKVETVQEFIELVRENEKNYNTLRKDLPQILTQSDQIIEDIEG